MSRRRLSWSEAWPGTNLYSGFTVAVMRDSQVSALAEVDDGVSRYELSDGHWERIASLLPGKAGDPGGQVPTIACA